MAKAFSFFDFDGVLYRGAPDEEPYSVYGFTRFLVSEGLVARSEYERLQEIFASYKQGRIGRRAMALDVIEHYAARCLKGKSASEIHDAAWRFWNRPSTKLMYGYVPQLLKMLSEHTKMVMLTGSSKEVLEPILPVLGFDRGDVVATVCVTHNGYFDGRFVEAATPEEKTKWCQAWRTVLSYNPEHSFAFGDSVSDVPLLKLVAPQNAFLVGDPTPALRQDAYQYGWNVIPYDGDVVGLVAKRLESIQSELANS